MARPLKGKFRPHAGDSTTFPSEIVDARATAPDCTASLTRTDLNEIILGQAKLPRLVTDGKVKIAGDPQKLQEMLSLLDSFEPWFDVVTTNPPPRN